MNQESLVNIHEASRILCVSETALRQWTDEGKIKAFITPGGHRRYSTAELQKFLTAQPKRLGVKDLAQQLEGTVEMLREVARKDTTYTSWYNELGRESQVQMARSGRTILELIIRYLSQPSRREESLRSARNTGRDMGRILSKTGLPLTVSVEVFLMHREPIMNALTCMLKGKRASGKRVLEAIPQVTYIMDETLVALVAAHQQQQKDSSNNRKEAPPLDLDIPSTL